MLLISLLKETFMKNLNRLAVMIKHDNMVETVQDAVSKVRANNSAEAKKELATAKQQLFVYQAQPTVSVFIKEMKQ